MAPPISSFEFDGTNPTDLELVIANCGFLILATDDYDDDPKKTALFLGQFVGAARTWAARQLATDPELTGQSYGEYVDAAKNAFGYDDHQSAAIARTQLSGLRHTGTIASFFADFDDMCARAEITADEPKLTMLLDKLKPAYRQALILSGEIPRNYARSRKRLMNIGASNLEGVATEKVQTQRPKCSHCKKKGHTKDTCRKLSGAPPSVKIKSEPKN